MTPNEYQIAAFKFAVYPQESAFEYLTLALMGECGELCNVYKKSLRNGEPYRDRIVDESGDVLWYIAAIASETGKAMETVVAYTRMERKSNRTPFQTLINIQYFAWNCAAYLDGQSAEIFTYHGVKLAAEVLYWLSHLWSFYGITLDEVLEYNLSKLTARAQTDSIKVHERDS